MKIALASVLLLAACSDDAPSGTPITYTGGYEDWSSTDAAFLGVFEATVTEVADPTNTASTAPNGRSTLELPGGVTSEVTFEHADYLPARATVDGDAPGGYALRGLATDAAEDFHADLGTTYDDAATLVLFEVRNADADPVSGVTLDVDGADGFHDDADHVWEAGATTAGGRYVVFPNIEPAAELAYTVTGRACDGPPSIVAIAGEVALVTLYCE